MFIFLYPGFRWCFHAAALAEALLAAPDLLKSHGPATAFFKPAPRGARRSVPSPISNFRISSPLSCCRVRVRHPSGESGLPPCFRRHLAYQFLFSLLQFRERPAMPSYLILECQISGFRMDSLLGPTLDCHTRVFFNLHRLLPPREY